MEQVTGYDADDIDDGYTFRFVIQKDGEVTVSDDMYKAVVNETTGTVSFVEIESGDALEIGGASNFTLLEVGDDVVLQVSDNSFVKYDGTSFSLVSSLSDILISRNNGAKYSTASCLGLSSLITPFFIHSRKISSI